MAITVQIPGSMRRFTANLDHVEVAEATTVGAVLQSVVQQHPPLRNTLFTSDGRLFAFVGIFLNSQDIRHLQKEATAVQSGDRVTLLPAVAGG
ncbi:MAG: MoaD/ThiS family protein [Rhodanobacter sp.]